MSGMIGSGIELMFIGMGAVFAFLTLLVWVTNTMSRLVMRFEPVKPVVTTSQTIPSPTGKSATDAELTAVISAAIKMHRDRRNKP